MTKEKLEIKLTNIIRHYKSIYEALLQAKENVHNETARDYIEIAQYRYEQAQMELEHILRDIEATKKINNYKEYDTRSNPKE